MDFSNVKKGDIWPYRYKYYPTAGDSNVADLAQQLRNVRNIGECTLWYSDPATLNDPFDCAPSAEERSEEKLLAMAENLYQKYPGYYRDAPSLSKEQIIHRMAKEEGERLSGAGFVNEFRSCFSILCLSRDPVNRLMWGHYGNSHKGFVLEFDTGPALENPPPTDEKLILPMPVIYTDKRPHFDGIPTDNFLRKDAEWVYEKEERIIRHAAASLVEFDPRCLSSVILGKFAPDSLKDQIETQISKLGDKGKHIALYRAEMHPEKYRLWIPEHPYFGDIDYKDPDEVYPPGDLEKIREEYGV